MTFEEWDNVAAQFYDKRARRKIYAAAAFEAGRKAGVEAERGKIRAESKERPLKILQAIISEFSGSAEIRSALKLAILRIRNPRYPLDDV